MEALQLDPEHAVVRKNYALFLRDHPEVRVKRNECDVDQTPLAKALSRSNPKYRSPVKSTGRKSVNTGTPKGRTPKKNIRTPTHYRPRRLGPELESFVEGN